MRLGITPFQLSNTPLKQHHDLVVEAALLLFGSRFEASVEGSRQADGQANVTSAYRHRDSVHHFATPIDYNYNGPTVVVARNREAWHMPLGIYPREPVEHRFWRKVDKTETCWLWTASVNEQGRGQFTVKKKHFKAHVFAFTLVHGPVPDGLELDHLCRNPRCVRPDHLEPVTHRVNMLRGETIAARNAAKTHCPAGHPYTDENTSVWRGQRKCRSCDRERHRRPAATRKVQQ